MPLRMLFSLVLLAAMTLSTVRADDDQPPIVAAVKAQLADPAKPFTMFVKIRVKDGQEKAFEAAFTNVVANTRKEPGCLTYDLTKLAGEKPVYVVYERWKNLEALTSHAKAPYIVKLLNQLPQFAEGGPELQVGVMVAE